MRSAIGVTATPTPGHHPARAAAISGKGAAAAMDACNEIMSELRIMQTKYFTSIEEFREDLKNLKNKIDAQNKPGVAAKIVEIIIHYGMASLAIKAFDYAGTFIGTPMIASATVTVVSAVKKFGPIRMLFGA